MRAHRGADAVGADQHIAALARAIGEDRGNAAAVLFDAPQRAAQTIFFRRQRIAQSAVEARPAAHDARRRLLDDDFTAAIETDDLRHLDAHRLVERDAGAPQDGDQLRMRPEPDAAARQFLGIALEDDRVPANAAEQMRGEKPAERAADHQRTRHLSAFLATAAGDCRSSAVPLHGVAQPRLSCPGR